MNNRVIADQDDIDEIWDCRLDGCSINFIHQNKTSHLSRKVITAILNGPVPERFKDDERLLPQYYTWVSACGFKDRTEKDIAFVILRIERETNQTNYRKGLSAIKRDFMVLSELGRINPYVTERIEANVAEKFIVKYGYPAWEIDRHGNIRRLSADEFKSTPPIEAPQMK